MAASRSTVSRRAYDSTLSSYPLRDAGVILTVLIRKERFLWLGDSLYRLDIDHEQILDLFVVEGNRQHCLIWARLVK